MWLFYFSSVQGFTQPLEFCRFDYTGREREHRDLIRFTNGCSDGYNPNFLRYGGNSQTNETIPVYHRAVDSGIGIRSILSLNNEPETTIIHIPGKSTKNVQCVLAKDCMGNKIVSFLTHFSRIFMQGIACKTKVVIVIETRKSCLMQKRAACLKQYRYYN